MPYWCYWASLSSLEYSPFRIGLSLTVGAAVGCGLLEALRRLEGGENGEGELLE